MAVKTASNTRTIKPNSDPAKNYDMSIDGAELVIRIPLAGGGEPSSTGKSLLVAKSGGFQSIGGFGVSFNVTKPNK